MKQGFFTGAILTVAVAVVAFAVLQELYPNTASEYVNKFVDTPPTGTTTSSNESDIEIEAQADTYASTTTVILASEVPIIDTSQEETNVVLPSESTSEQHISVFVDSFDRIEVVEESANMDASTSDDWWVSSGGYFFSSDGVGNTVVGTLSQNDYWYNRYAETNSRDTDNGTHPQNIFRLVQKNRWTNLEQEAYFKILNDNLSESEYRNGSNGLLFFNRYQDEYNLYYTGIRVDGHVAIKKKIDGEYYDLAYEPYIQTDKLYDRDTNPNLLPHGAWIGLRSNVITNDDGTVTIRVYIDWEQSGVWELVAEAIDDGVSFGGVVFADGYAGIRTDFMDVQFDTYRVAELDELSY